MEKEKKSKYFETYFPDNFKFQFFFNNDTVF